MRSVRSLVLWVLWVILTALASNVLLSNVSFAASVQACKNLKQSRFVDPNSVGQQKKARKVYCSIQPTLGKVGDVVEIKNQYNYIVAVGRIVRHYRTSSLVVLTKVDRQAGSMAGYSVMVRAEENQDYWTATTAPF